MVLNLNKTIVSKEGILEHIQDIDIYNFYANQPVDLSGNQLSPLREEKKNSFGYFVGKSDEICFNDFVLGTGDCIRFVELMFGLTYFEALSQIATDFDIVDKFSYCKKMEKTTTENKDIKKQNRDEVLRTVNINQLGVRRRNWAAHDLLYWDQFGISKKTLVKYDVSPIDYIFYNVNKAPIKADKYAYVFNEFKDDKHTMKIYQPFNKDFKWLNNHDDSVWQGWTQMPEKGEILIITKSLKDVMSITEVLGYNSIALQSESVTPKQHILDELNSKFNTLYLLYDNDFDKEYNIGRVLGAKIVEDQPIIQLEIPTVYKCKDFSDLVAKYGVHNAKEIYKTSVEMPY